MNEWDWDKIYVYSGEWWLLVIGLALLLVGFAIGYFVGRSLERKECDQRIAWRLDDYRNTGR